MKGVVELGGPQLGLTAEEAKDLCSNLDRVYANISADALSQPFHPPLPHCLSDKRAKQGHYFAYYPPHASDKTPGDHISSRLRRQFSVLHLSAQEEFPASIVLVPSWGASWENGTMQYLDDMLADVKRKKSISIHESALMAISAGGPAGFRLYNDHPDRFPCYVSLASGPPQAIVPLLKEDLRFS